MYGPNVVVVQLHKLKLKKEIHWKVMLLMHYDFNKKQNVGHLKH